MLKTHAFPSRFLKAADLGDEPITLTIAGVTYETLKDYDGRERKKPVASFLKTPKVLVINGTNFDLIAEVTGEPDSDNWIGHKVELYAAEAQIGSKTVACVRVRAPEQPVLTATRRAVKQPPEPAATAADDMDDAVPF